MSLATKAAGGFLWASAATIGARVFTILSTFVLTRYLAPAVQGEVNLAYVLVATGGAVSTLGVAQFIAAHPKEGRDTAFHGTFLVLLVGGVVCLGCILSAEPVGLLLNVPGMARYVPGMVIAHYLERCGWVPRALLVREMRFRLAGLRVALGELSFAVSSVAFAHAGFGGDAIVGGNIVRSVVGLGFLVVVIDRRDYLLPCRLSLATMRKILEFGLPITIAGLFAMGAATWDNSFIGYRFGEATVGIYNQAYRLADLPTSAIGDHVNDVLVPTFARTPDMASTHRGFFRAASLMALVVFPMALGMGAVAPTMVETFYPESYSGVGPLLIVLAVLSIPRSIGRLAGALVQVLGRTRVFVAVELTRVVCVLGFMAALARFGAVWSAGGVIAGYFVALCLTLAALGPFGIRLAAVGAALWRPLLACAPMVGLVLAVRYGVSTLVFRAGFRLVLELMAGALGYVGGAFLFAPRESRDMIGLAKSLLRRDESTPASKPTGA
ncbi:MAG: oligosaccharide flippase family protein [Polyangiaceae bacterium]|nr:oligosaccharide flippase family protein [Polyangiaceae bacterium]